MRNGRLLNKIIHDHVKLKDKDKDYLLYSLWYTTANRIIVLTHDRPIITINNNDES